MATESFFFSFDISLVIYLHYITFPESFLDWKLRTHDKIILSLFCKRYSFSVTFLLYYFYSLERILVTSWMKFLRLFKIWMCVGKKLENTTWNADGFTKRTFPKRNLTWWKRTAPWSHRPCSSLNFRYIQDIYIISLYYIVIRIFGYSPMII